VVAGGLEWLWQACQEAAAVVGDRRSLAMHGAGRGNDPAPERGGDRLVPQADAQRGTRPLQARTTSTLMPASAGVPSPGEITRPAPRARPARLQGGRRWRVSAGPP
jgi:hypothetical protein